MELKKKAIESAASELTKQVILLLLPLLSGLVLALVPQVRDRILPVLPKPLLAVVVGISLSLNLALVFYVLYLRKQQRLAKSEIEQAQGEAVRLQDLIDNPPLTAKFGVLWSQAQVPHCPACKNPLGHYASHTVPDSIYGRWGFKCIQCSQVISMSDDTGHILELSAVKRMLSSNEIEPLTETLEAARPHKVKHLPDLTKVSHAISTLEIIKGNLPPRGSIEEKYVIIYNNAIGDISENVDGKVSDFFIPQTELEHHLVSQRIGPRVSRFDKGPDKTYSKERYCDREIVLMAIDRAINHLKQLLQTRY